MQPQQLCDFLADKADDMKAEQIVTLDVTGKSSITDTMIICTGTSKRHVSSIAEHITKEAKLEGIEPIGMDGEIEGEWVVVDMGDAMVHILQQEQRELYQLEKLWG